MDSEQLALKPHQYGPALAVARYFGSSTERQKTMKAGVLVNYEVGTGKTFAALHAARTFVDSQDGCVYIITTRANTESTWARDWAVYKRALNKTPGTSAPYTRSIKWGTKHEVCGLSLVSPYMLIVDEAHLLRNLESKSAPQIQRLTKDASYVMLLTATPIVRTVSNLNALFSYMAGHGKSVKLVGPRQTPSAVEIGKSFHRMVLYHPQDRSCYPTVTSSVVNVPLGDHYEVFVRDDALKLKRVRDELKSRRIKGERWNTTIARACAFEPEEIVPNPFHVNSRRACNSQKYQQIWNTIVGNGETRIVVFSNFRDEGVDGFMDWLLKTQRFHRTGKRDYAYVVRKDGGGPKFEVVLWSNDHFEAITKWQHKRDDIVKILLLSPMAREGLSLKRVRELHLMEPSWNISDESQAIGRAVRMTSHVDMPLSQRTIHVRRWIATYTGGETADERVAELAELSASMCRPYSQRLQFVGKNFLCDLHTLHQEVSV